MISDATETSGEWRPNILYRDEALLVLNKPAGLSVQDSPSSRGYFNLIREKLSLNEAYPVHRLDQGTSGIYLIALNRAAASALGHAFEHGHVEKIYLALSSAKGKKKQGWVIGDMVPARGGSYKLLPQRSHPAMTYFLGRSLKPGLRAMALKLYTGKTHQARVALKSVSAPILGDARYGGQSADRMYLHAAALQLNWSGRVPVSLVCWPSPQEGVLWNGIEAVFSEGLLSSSLFPDRPV